MARDPRAYWRANLRILAILLSVWALAGFGLGIVAVPWLNAVQVAGFPLGFWFAQQGSIVVFVLLILVYALWMDRIERRRAREGDGPSRVPTPGSGGPGGGGA